MIGYFIFLLVVFFLFSFLFSYSQTSKMKKVQIFKLDPKKIAYSRMIPNCSLEEAFFISSIFGISENASDFVGAVILKWIKEKKIKIVKKDDHVYFDMRDFSKMEDGYERDLYFKLLVASGKNKILEANEFVLFFEQEEIVKLLKDIFVDVRDQFVREGQLKRKVYGFTYKYYISSELEAKAYQLAGLKKFLLDFSVIHKRESIEVALWEDYLVYAQLFGIADKVDEQMENIYPDFNKMLDYQAFSNAVIATFMVTFNFALIPLLAYSKKS